MAAADDPWIPKAEAERILGVSGKTIETWVDEGKLHQQKLGRHRGAKVLIHAGDVEALRREREGNVQPFLLPAVVEERPPAALETGRQDSDRLLALLEWLTSQKTSEKLPAPAYVGHAEALRISGLLPAGLLRAIRAGKVTMDGPLYPLSIRRYRRADLEAL